MSKGVLVRASSFSDSQFRNQEHPCPTSMSGPVPVSFLRQDRQAKLSGEKKRKSASAWLQSAPKKT